MKTMKLILVTVFTLLLAASLPLAAAPAGSEMSPTNAPTVTNTVAKAAGAVAASASGGSVTTVMAFMAMVLALGAIGLVLFFRSRQQAQPGSSGQSASDETMRSQLAVNLTAGALLFIGAIAGLVLICAGLNALLPPYSTEKTTLFFDIVKYLLTALLPVVAGWVGTVLAFYYGKANFEAATKSVKDMATAMTSKDKLAATPVRVLGKTKAEITFYPLSTTLPDEAKRVTMDVIEQAFTNPKDKTTYERLPVLFSNDVPYLVLHRSRLTDFLLQKKSADPNKSAADYKLSDLFAAQTWLPETSFVTVGPNATAAEAREKMGPDNKCTDVVVTQDGSPTSAMVRWITNVDLLKAAEV
jgi:hypothetical protein